MIKGFTIWLTGLSGAGKTTLARALVPELRARGLRVEHLDGDIVRKELTRDLGFSKEDREENIRRVAFVAKLLTRNDVVCVVSFISPYRRARDRARGEIQRFVEVYVECPLEVCEQRDVKGLYQKARTGEVAQFTGISDPYEEPLHPEIIVKSAEMSVDNAVAHILAELERREYL